MGKTRDTGFLNNCVFTDSSNNVGIGGAANASYKLAVTGASLFTGAATFSSSVTSTGYTATANTSGGFAGLTLANSGTGAAQILLNNSAQSWIVNLRTDNHFSIYNNTAATTPFFISTSGNVGIGTSSPTCTLEVARNNGGSTGGQIALRNSSSSTLSSTTEISFLNDTGASASGTRNGRIISQMENVGNGASNMQFWTWSGSTDAERMRITSSGQVLINTTSTLAGGSLGINGNLNFGGTAGGNYRITNYQAGYLAFDTDNTERMRITSGGKVLIGTSSVISGNYMVQASGNGGFVTNASNSGDSSYYSVTDTVGWHFYAEGGGSTKMYVLQNGDVRNANNSYGAISDISLKENITDATPKLADLLKVKVRNYNLITDEKKEKQLGVIAQELEEVFPNMISEDKKMGSDETIKTVKYSVFVPMLVKAIQEQQEIINNLSAKVTALENR